MRRSGRAWMVPLALGLMAVTAGLTRPGVAETASVTIESHRRQGAPGSDWRGGEHRSGWRDNDHGRPGWGGHSSSWHGHRPGGYWGWSPGWYAPAPVWVPPRWVWVGYGWVVAPGYWR